jgi:hypothetical protein
MWRHGRAINKFYKHHPVFGIYDIKIRNIYVATYTIIYDKTMITYFLILTQSNLKDVLLCVNF